jgi:hypothetical protein
MVGRFPLMKIDLPRRIVAVEYVEWLFRRIDACGCAEQTSRAQQNDDFACSFIRFSKSLNDAYCFLGRCGG